MPRLFLESSNKDLTFVQLASKGMELMWVTARIFDLKAAKHRRSNRSSSCAVCISFACFALLSACSSSGLTISSSPEGAEVTNLQGELLGKTPITLSSDQTAKISDSGLLNFKVAAPGYLPRLVHADGGVAREISVALPKSEAGSFKSEFLRDFGRDMNKMLRAAFVIQKLIGQRKIDEAAREIETFKKEYPSIAYGHVMSAHLALVQGKREEAKASMSRAQALDPEDGDISQSLKLISSTPTSGVAP